MMNKGGKGCKTTHKWCYVCNARKDKDAFSVSQGQWEAIEGSKSRRCALCITANRKVSMATAGQLTLFGVRAAVAGRRQLFRGSLVGCRPCRSRPLPQHRHRHRHRHCLPTLRQRL